MMVSINYKVQDAWKKYGYGYVRCATQCYNDARSFDKFCFHVNTVCDKRKINAVNNDYDSL